MQAERIVLDGGEVRAEGAVTVQIGGQAVRGELVGLVDGGRLAVVVHGALDHPSLGEVRFDRAEVDLATGTTTLFDAHLTGDDGLRAAAGTLTLDADGAVVASDIDLTLCDCATPPPWTVHAKRATLRDDVVRFRGGLVDVAGVPLLPVPFGELPLTRRSGLLPPTLETGVNGVVVGLPAYLVLGRSADITLTPEVLTARGARLVTETRWAVPGGTGQIDASGGWDTVTAGPRGAASWDHAAHRGTTGFATTGQLVSDLPYLADYGDGFLSRRQPWSEVRGVLGWGAAELTTNVFQAPDAVDQQLVGVGLYRPAVDVGGGLLVAADARGALWAAGADPWSVEDPGVSTDARVSASRPTWAGPLRVTPRVDGEAGWSDALSPDARGTAAAEVALPLWRPHPRAWESTEFAVTSAWSEGIGDFSTATGWTVAPSVAYRVVDHDLSAHVRAATPMAADGARAAVDAQGGTDVLSGWVQLDTAANPWDLALAEVISLASTGLRGEVRRVRLEGRWLYAAPSSIRQPAPDDTHALHQLRASARVGLPGPLSTFTVSGGGAYDLDGAAFVTRRVGLSWRHPTGCVALGAVGELSADRALPDVALRLDVSPAP